MINSPSKKFDRREYDQKRYREQRAEIIAYSVKWQKNNPEKAKARAVRYRQRHREKINANSRLVWINEPEKRRSLTRRWRLKNLSYCADVQKQWRSNHPGYYVEYFKSYRKANADKRRRGNKQWKLRNPELVYEQRVRRRASKSNADIGDARISKLITNWKLKKSFTCYYCRRRFRIKFLTTDHIIPISKGGKHTVTNVCQCCFSCNSSKRAKPVSDFSASGQGFLGL